MSTAEVRVSVALEADVASTPQLSPPGQWTLFWRRFKRDKWAFGSLILFALLLLLCFVGEPLFRHLLGHGPNDLFFGAADDTGHPVPPWTHIPVTASEGGHAGRTVMVLGGDGSLGRDEFLRLLKGGQTSLIIGLGSTFLAILVGVPLGALAGMLGGTTDALVSRLTEFFMGFPILLLLVALGYSVRSSIDHVTLHHLVAPGVVALTLLIGLFTWFYPARITRATVFQLRQQDFIEASRMVGGSTRWIIRKHMLPHLVGPIAVYFSIIAAANIVLESAISFMNIGIELPDPSWGNMLAGNWGHFFIVDRPSGIGIVTSAWTTALPAAAIAFTVLCLALIGEGVREAFDPGSRARAR
jgi:peptide/nickel transport system permease protein